MEGEGVSLSCIFPCKSFSPDTAASAMVLLVILGTGILVMIVMKG